jgi:hypothetical protein
MTTATLNNLPPSADRILAWENKGIVERYARTYATSYEDALACFNAWKQFMALTASRRPGSGIPSGPIDEMWHTALVFTKPYREFCTTYLGRFVDHNPQEHSNPAGYEATLDAARVLFGDLDVRFWTTDGACCGIDCCKDD